MDVDPRSITIIEARAPWREDFGPEWSRMPIARLRYTQRTKLWTLYWVDRNGKFHNYDRIKPTLNVQTLLDEIDTDPTNIFWG